ncbi:hypothetical protein HHK36_017199 [Tetracentron sinense]|uniref:Myb/SANT-like domain-containing protein n=1 Tax=Tetracentron sinense TaxID=13715 RepID=A0A834Z7I7_TETSI|nr:hypothetical protein HHK36_017199 [Tetracentron sinense]
MAPRKSTTKKQKLVREDPEEEWENREMGSQIHFGIDEYFRDLEDTAWAVRELEHRQLQGLFKPSAPTYPRLVRFFYQNMKRVPIREGNALIVTIDGTTYNVTPRLIGIALQCPIYQPNALGFVDPIEEDEEADNDIPEYGMRQWKKSMGCMPKDHGQVPSHHVFPQAPLKDEKLGVNFLPLIWKIIINKYKEKIGRQYSQKQLRNQLDAMKRLYNAWVVLCGQTGIGRNDATNTITMDPERWEAYVETHRDAKPFMTKPLPFPEEMALLFDGISATGAAKWAPTIGSVPQDLLGNTHSSNALSDNIEIPSSNVTQPHNETQQKAGEEVDDVELMENIRRK